MEFPEFEAVIFPVNFKDKNIPNIIFKQELLKKEEYEIKLIKFYHDFEKRNINNEKFLNFFRFYYSDLEPEKLENVFFYYA